MKMKFKRFTSVIAMLAILVTMCVTPISAMADSRIESSDKYPLALSKASSFGLVYFEIWSFLLLTLK